MARKIACVFSFMIICILIIGLNPDRSDAFTRSYTVVYESIVDGTSQIFMMDIANPDRTTQLTFGNFDSKHPTITGDKSRVYYYHWTPTSWSDMNLIYFQNLNERRERLFQRNAIHEEEDPSVSADGSTLAFRARQSIVTETGTIPYSDNWEINCVRTDLSVISRITKTMNDEYDPCLNGDGSVVYFAIAVEKRRRPADIQEDESPTYKFFYIYKNTFDGDNLERVTPRDYSARHPSVDADERWMVFQSDMDGDDEIYIMDLATSEVTRLTESEGFDGKPNISSDGEVIVFVSERTGTRQVFKMNRDGSELVQLTDEEDGCDNPDIN